jgi:hypothetical protein
MNKTSFILCLAAVVISPLLFGASYTFAYTLVFLLVLIAGFFTLKASINKNSVTGLWQFIWPTNPLLPLFLGFFFYLILQMIPLPASVLTKLSIVARVVGEKSLPAAAMPELSVNDFWFAIASYVYPVRTSLVRWIIYGIFLWSFVVALDSRKKIETAVIIILVIGCFESLYGIIQTYSSHEHIWWYKKIPECLGFPSGTYPNRNHFAGFMEMGIILSVAYGVLLYDRHNKRQKVLKLPLKSLQAKVLNIFSAEQLYTKIFLVVFSGVIMGLGLFLSGSRGGITSLSLALVVIGIFFTGIKTYRRPGLYILIPFLILTTVYAIIAGIDPTVDRFRVFDIDLLHRADLAEKALHIFDDYQLFGVGIGNLPNIFPKYQDLLFPSRFVNYAHNDWAQLLAESGICGFIIFIAGIGYYIVWVLRKWKHAQDAFAVCLGIAPIIALISIGIHSFSDFNLHIPANMILLTAVIAIGCRAFYPEKDKTDQGFVWIPLRAKAMLIIAACGIMILGSGTWVIRHFVAESYCNTIHTPPLKLDQHPSASSIRKAVQWDGGNARYRFKLATALMTERDKKMMDISSDERPVDNSLIIKTLEETIRLNPFTAEYHIRLGWEYSYLWYVKEYHARWLPAADLCMERAAYFNGAGAANPYLHIDMGKYWTMRSKTLEYDPARQHTTWIKARWHFKKALELNNTKQVKDEITGYINDIYSDQKRVQEAIE